MTYKSVNVHTQQDSHQCILGIVLSCLTAPGINMVALEEAQGYSKHTWVVVEHSAQERDKQAMAQICTLGLGI